MWISAGDHGDDGGCARQECVEFDAEFFLDGFCACDQDVVGAPFGSHGADVFENAPMHGGVLDVGIGDELAASAGCVGVVLVKITQVFREAVPLAGAHFSGTSAVFDSGFHDDFFVHMLGDGEVQIQVEVFAPSATPEVFLDVAVDFVFDFDFIPSVQFFAECAGAAFFFADHAVVADGSRFQEGRGGEYGVCDDGHIALMGTELGRKRQSVVSEFGNSGGDSAVHVWDVGCKLRSQVLVSLVSPDV